MRAFLRSLLSLTLIHVPAGASALDFASARIGQATSIDTLRDQCRLARYGGDLDRASRLQGEILNRIPGDGFTLREVVLSSGYQGRLTELLDRLAAGDVESLFPGIRLGEGDVLFMRGYGEFLRDRNATAKQLLEQALTLRPDCGWCHLGLARSKHYLFAPRSEIDQHFAKALADSLSAPRALADLGWYRQRELLGWLCDGVDDHLDKLRRIPWTAETVDEIAALRFLGRSRVSRDQLDSLWTGLWTVHGECVINQADQFAYYARFYLPPDEALQFLSDREGEASDPREWTIARARLLDSIGYPERADSILSRIEGLGPGGAQLFVRLAEKLHGPAILRERTQSLLDASFSQALMVTESAFRDLGDEERIRDLKELILRESPADYFEDRLMDLLRNDLHAAQMFLDSLSAFESDFRFLRTMRSEIREAGGDTLAVSTLIDSLPGIDGAVLAGQLSLQASDKGDHERAERLERATHPFFDNSVSHLMMQLNRAAEVGGGDYASELAERLRELCSDCPVVMGGLTHAFLILGDRATTRSELQAAGERSDLPPTTLASLAVDAFLAGEHETASTLIGRAEERAPDSRTVRYYRAWLLLQQRKLDEARVQFESLVSDFPGSETYRSFLLSAGGIPHAPESPIDEDDLADRYKVFGHDLESVERLLEARVEPDSFRTHSAVQLFNRTSYVCDQIDSYARRVWYAMQILSEESIDGLQTRRIVFRPSSGTPVIRQARVIQPDGTVVQVPHSDMLVTTDQDFDIDIGDRRHLVVPFPDLEVGSILEIAYDQRFFSLFGSGWDFRHYFGPLFPTQEQILEVKFKRGIPWQTSLNGALPEVTTREVDPYQIYSWRMTDLDPLEIEPDSPNISEQIPWVGGTSHESWVNASTPYREMYWRNVQVSPEIRALSELVTKDFSQPEERITAILGYLASNMNYLAIELDRGRIVPTPSVEVLERGYGDCKDIVTLLIALLEAVDIEAEPVLVSSNSQGLIQRDFVEMSYFSHMIAHVPHVQGGLFLDPTMELGCIGPLTPDLSGTLGLALPRAREPYLCSLVSSSPRDHGYEMTVDLEPLSEKEAEIKVTASYRGELAQLIRSGIGLADTTSAQAYVDRFLAWGLWGTCRRDSWEIIDDECTSFALTATYRDTAWAGLGLHSVPFQYRTEVADPLLEYPTSEKRKMDVILPFPFEDKVTLRFYNRAGWEASGDVASVSVKGEFYEGRIEKKSVADADGGHLEVRQTFQVDSNRIPVEQYKQFYGDWRRFLVGVYQYYRMHRRLDEKRLAQLGDYAKQHPDDSGFALEAAGQILGDDLGGEGEAGEERRATAERLLRAAARSEDAGSLPLVFLSAIEMKRGRYFAADSLLTEGLRRDSRDLICLTFLAQLKGELEQRGEQVRILRKLVNIIGGAEQQVGLIAALYADGQIEDAESAEARYFALHGDADSTAVILARFNGLFKADRCAESGQALEWLKSQISETQYWLLSSDHQRRCGSFDESVVLLEKLWSDDPLNALVCNNLAWCYALLGKNLDRAQELVNAALVLSEDRAASENTLAAIYARNRDWKKAQEVFQRLWERDDRPRNRAVNEYFLGLCDYEMGRREEAVERWERILPATPERIWREWIQKSLDLAASGGIPSEAIFAPLPEEEP